MTRILSVASGKGGVGKTTVVSNLGAVLTEAGEDVTLVDGNLTTANLSLHLGIPLYPVTLHDVLKEDALLPEAMYIHPTGIRVVPSGIGIDDLRETDSRDLPAVLGELMDETEMILLDTAAGLGQETISTLEASDEVLIVTHPTMPSVTDALKTKNLADELGVETVGAVVNHSTGSKDELTNDEVSEMLDGLPVLARIPRDDRVPESVSMKKPVVHHAPRSPASREMRKLASEFSTEDIDYQMPRRSIFQRIADILR
ncbi:MAG: cell division ATPase MinD [Candidatus Aenigmatarchaeota archaeon]